MKRFRTTLSGVFTMLSSPNRVSTPSTPGSPFTRRSCTAWSLWWTSSSPRGCGDWTWRSCQEFWEHTSQLDFRLWSSTAQHITQWHFNPLEIHWTQVSEPLVAWLWHGVSNLWPGGHCCARQHHLCPSGNLISFYFQRNTKHGWLFTISILFSSVYEFPNSLSSSQLLHKQHHSSPSLEMQRHPDHAGDRPQPQGQWQGGGGHAQAEQPDPSQHGWW